ncbi:uncharacterized protein LOC112052508 [Bicyclus anynana]|uniref:Uncharacterized protein LOC112052508 n=1 Tax=Bicyclus anynana TaxID=110368 RepID=A0A6J1NQJ3_BICAN|nr:uncharacterized protein LOC112052508 [Bicyclus anynana]
MDLKGSLVDTNIRIYPSEKLIAFIQTVPHSDEVPHNILQIIKANSKNNFKSYKLELLKSVQLNNSDIEYLKTVRDSFDELHKDKAVGTDEELENENRESATKNTADKKVENKTDTHTEPDNNKGAENENDSQSEDKKPSKESLNSDESKSQEQGPFLVTSDIDWLYMHIKTRRSNGEKNVPHLHTLLEGASIEMPENETIKRNPVLEARCVKLRAQQEAREYRKMTKGVDNVRMRFPEDSISYQLKQINRHLIAIGQFIISIFAGFLFGFRGVEWMVGNLDFGFRLLLGVMVALVIALAEIYFLAKKLNEELCIPDTVQLGGPVKFADEDSYNYKNNESGTKPHQD